MRRHFERCHESKLSELFPNVMSSYKRNEIEKCELLHNAIELVTVNGFPFSILDTSAMKGNFLLVRKNLYFYRGYIKKHGYIFFENDFSLIA